MWLIMIQHIQNAGISPRRVRNHKDAGISPRRIRRIIRTPGSAQDTSARRRDRVPAWATGAHHHQAPNESQEKTRKYGGLPQGPKKILQKPKNVNAPHVRALSSQHAYLQESATRDWPEYHMKISNITEVTTHQIIHKIIQRERNSRHLTYLLVQESYP